MPGAAITRTIARNLPHAVWAGAIVRGTYFATSFDVASPHHSSGSSGDDDHRVGELIVGYLRDHPFAEDTLDGILQFWLPRQIHLVEGRRVKRVLDDLVRTRTLEAVGSSANPRYRLPSYGEPS